LIPFNPDLVLEILPTKKKYTSELLSPSVEITIRPAELSSQITTLEIKSSSRPETPISQVTVTNGTMIMQFPIGNTLIIEGMIDRLDTQTPLIATYKTTIKTFVQYAAAKALVQDTTMNKLKEAAANKKKRSKQTVGLSCVCPETWEIHQEAQRIAKRAK
jgi:hypothetical protein